MKHTALVIASIIAITAITPAFAELSLPTSWTGADGIKHVEYEFNCRFNGDGDIQLSYYDNYVWLKYTEDIDGKGHSHQRTFTFSDLMNDIMPYYKSQLDKAASSC
jgi:hypothetical protein